MSTPPLCPPCDDPVSLSGDEAFFVQHNISREQAALTAHKAIRDSVFRPRDIGEATIELPHLAYVPYWRFGVSAEGFHLGLMHGQGSDGSLKWVLPTGGVRHRKAVVLVEARKLVPFTPALQSLDDVRTRLSLGFTIEREQMEPRDRCDEARLDAAEWIEPDVTRETAEKQAVRAILRFARPSSALYAKYKPSVESAACCHYPLHVTRYHYEGHAAATTGDSFFVTLSGRTGKVVAKHHPSALRSITRKLRDWLTP